MYLLLSSGFSLGAEYTGNDKIIEWYKENIYKKTIISSIFININVQNFRVSSIIAILDNHIMLLILLL